MRKFMFTVGLVSFVFLSGCSQENTVPNAVVTPSRATTQIPIVADVKEIYVIGGPSTHTFIPNDQVKTILEVESWLKSAQPVSVQFPQQKSRKQHIYSAYTGPSILELKLQKNQNITIFPAYYEWSTDGGKYTNYYINDVIGYQTSYGTTYFKVPELYRWLKNGEWEQEFKTHS